jgi:16S rRNA processing protein RimM
LRAPGRLVLLGAFGAPRGVRGETRVKSFARDPLTIGAYGPLTDAARSRDFVFESLRLLKDDMLAARVKGVATREAAAALNGLEIFARRDQLPQPDADEFYYDDLIGLEAVAVSGERLGRVVSLVNYGAGDILEIAPADGRDTVLLPFAKAVTREIDFDAGRIVIDRPLEIEAEERG